MSTKSSSVYAFVVLGSTVKSSQEMATKQGSTRDGTSVVAYFVAIIRLTVAVQSIDRTTVPYFGRLLGSTLSII